MNLRKITLALAVACIALTLTSCGSARRLGKDVTMTVLSPLTMLYGASTDAFTTAHDARDGLSGGKGGTFTEVITSVVVFPFHLAKHGVYSLCYAADIFLFPIYGAAELHPYGPEIEPLGFYTGTWFDKKPDTGEGDKSSTDAESGETTK